MQIKTKKYIPHRPFILSKYRQILNNAHDSMVSIGRHTQHIINIKMINVQLKSGLEWWKKSFKRGKRKSPEIYLFLIFHSQFYFL